MNVSHNPTTRALDVVGDVHGCYDELVELVEKLGYERDEQDGLYRHPEGRHLVFVGDLTDRGPKNRLSLLFGLRHAEAGLATYVQGNHDNKLGRALKGNPIKVGHGLADTLAELHDMSENAKLKLSERVLSQPLYATFDDGKLLVCHAAPPPEGASKGKTFSTCLYGHTTGRKTDKGFPERLNWVPSYNAKATEDTPFVVFGHVTHKEPYLTDKACCIDTACFAGNELSAFRWPEHKVVSVKSKQVWDGETDLVLHDKKSSPTPTIRAVSPSPITTLYLPDLLEELHSREEDILYLIDTDDKLKKREHDNGLVIANSSPALFEPELEHQMFAKGIVYTRDPYRLVSLPLVKMYNHTMREVSDNTTQRLLREGDVRIAFPEKADGTMIQVFEHEDEVYLTTRSVLEGTMKVQDEGFDYLSAAREILESKYPTLANPDNVRGFSLIFELIHPESRIVTDYGDRKDLVLLAVYDHEERCYQGSEFLRRMPTTTGATVTEFHEPRTGSFDGDVSKILSDLDDRDDMPEGVIAVFEREGKILHRIKIKTQDYLRYHRLKFHCTYKSVVNLAWHDESLQEWPAFLEYLRGNGLTEEEVESFYQEHFEQFLVWLDEVKSVKEEVETYLSDFNADTEVDPSDKRLYFKTLALQAKTEVPSDIFGLVMNLARSGELHLREVMRSHPAYDGFKGEVDRWMQEQD